MGTTPKHCSPCFLVAKPGSTTKRLVVDHGELNKKTLNHSGSIPNLESTLEKIASCRYKDGQAYWILASGPDAQRPGTPCLHHPPGEGAQVEGHALWRGQRTRSFPRADEQGRNVCPARARRAAFRLCSPRRAPKHTPWNYP